MNVEIVLLRDMEQAQQSDRIGLEEILGRDRQPLAVDDKAFERAAPGTPADPGQAALVLLIGFEDRAENPSQIADILRDQEIVLHEPFDTARPGMIGVAHAAADLGLQVEGQPLLGAAGEIMQVTAHRP